MTSGGIPISLVVVDSSKCHGGLFYPLHQGVCGGKIHKRFTADNRGPFILMNNRKRPGPISHRVTEAL